MRHPLLLLAVIALGCVRETGLSRLDDPAPEPDTAAPDDGPDTAAVEWPRSLTDTGEPPDPDPEPPDTDPPDPDPPSDRVRTAGQEHWLAFMENLDLGVNDAPRFRVVLRAEDGPATGEIAMPAISYTQPFALAAGQVEEIALPDVTLYEEGSEVRGTTGIRVTSDAPVEVSGVHYRLYFTEASIALPTAELGHDYRVIASTDEAGGDPSSFVVLATTDETVIEITPSVLTEGLKAPGIPYTVTLAAGETWQVQSGEDLSGTRVRSVDELPIAVFGGAKQADIDCDEFADNHLWDQLYPISRWGRHYQVVPFSEKERDTVRIVAHTDGTRVQLDCGTPTTLDAGETLKVRVSTATAITASAPVGVAQFARSGGCDIRIDEVPEVTSDGTVVGSFETEVITGDPNMLTLAPTALTRTSSLWKAVDDNTSLQWATLHALGVWAPSGGPLRLDGDRVDADLVDGAGAFRVEEGVHRVEADQGAQFVAYGFDQWDAYTYHLGYDCVDCLGALTEAPDCD
jgi:hypothetical protein